jgi:hypothetical protein
MPRVPALTLALAVTLAVPARASEPPRRLMPEVCESAERPAVTSLAVPARVRSSAHRAELVARARPGRSRRAAVARWLLVAAAAAAASAFVVARTR